MIILDTILTSLEIDLVAAVTTNQLPVVSGFADVGSSNFSITEVGSEDTQTNDTTVVTIVPAPASGKTRQIKAVFIQNQDTVDATVIVQLNNNSTLRRLIKTTLQPDDTLQYVDGQGWSFAGKKNVNVISVLNSRPVSTLAAGAVFQGVGEDVSAYGRAGIAIISDNATDGVLTIETSHNGVNFSSRDREWSDTMTGQPHMWNIVEKFFRIKYTNGTLAAENLSIQVQYSVNIDILLAHQLNETLQDETEGIVVRSLLVGQDETGAYTNVRASAGGNLIIKEEFGKEIAITLAGIAETLEGIKDAVDNIANP